ncbi:SLATT domain-containing protein [Neobacillus sp.]|uniref:SLATT domain-containing protein n=1 Tax=Neobacillus sp. TaxID=2675273 RepID=UPI0035B54358
MKKDLLLKQLADNGYNVIYGGKKHFSTFDIVEKMPGRIAFFTLTIGILQIYKPNFPYNSEISLLLILASIMALTISQYNGDKKRYEEVGNRLIQIHNELREIYYQVQSSENENYSKESNEIKRMNELVAEYYRISIPKQIIFSDWLAHYKLFVQNNYDWLDKQKDFKWMDKIPLSFIIAVVVVVVLVIVIVIYFKNGGIIC